MLAAGLLAALGWAALAGVNRSSDADDRGRRADREQVTKAVADSLGIQAALDAARDLAAAASAKGAFAAVAEYRPVGGFREAIIATARPNGPLHREAGGLRYDASDGSFLPCRAAQDGDGLNTIARATADVSPIATAFTSPACVPVVGAAARSGNTIAVVLADRAAILARIEAFNALTGGRASLFDGSNTVGDVVSRADGAVAAFLQGPHVPAGIDQVGTGSAAVVRSWASPAPGWTLIVDQDAGAFTEHRLAQPSTWIPVGVAGCFALAVLVVGFFDVRRRRALVRADEDRSAFLAVVGHELRTPLTVLKGFVETLTARWDNLQDAQRQNLVERLGPQVRRLHRGVDRLLIAADIQRGANLRFERVPVDVGDALDTVAESFRPVAPLHTFVVDAQEGLTAMADKKALGQVLDQIVDNAVKYSPSGGTVTLEGRRVKGRVELVVEDEGVGLPSDSSRIFEPLTQGEEVERRTHDEGGVGVGLFIVRTLVERMGGTVRAERRGAEAGTRLVVTLAAGSSRSDGGEQLARRTAVHGQF